MSSIKHILFPVDFSERCDGAVSFVAEMARENDAKVTLIAIAEQYYPVGLPEAPLLDPQLVLDDLKSQLDGAFVNDLAGLKVDRVAMLGDPAQTIIDFVATNKVDLVMMPTHGYGPVRQLLLGSVTAKVLHDVNVPVWTTAQPGDASDREHVAPRQVLCAVDGSPASVDLMRWAREFCKSVGATLRLVHVIPGVETLAESQMDLALEETMRENMRHTIHDLERAVDIEAPVCVGAGSVPDVVRDEALEHDADLVLIGRGALRSTLGRLRTHSYGIIRHAPCPVVSV